MTLEIKKHFSAGWVALVISFIGAAGFYLWQPITDYFISGTFDENVILQIETDTLKSDGKSQLLVIHTHYRPEISVNKINWLSIPDFSGIGSVFASR